MALASYMLAEKSAACPLPLSRFAITTYPAVPLLFFFALNYPAALSRFMITTYPAVPLSNFTITNYL